MGVNSLFCAEEEETVDRAAKQLQKRTWRTTDRSETEKERAHLTQRETVIAQLRCIHEQQVTALASSWTKLIRYNECLRASLQLGSSWAHRREWRPCAEDTAENRNPSEHTSSRKL